jgi:peptidoglycan/xylan/chitin deacetylase (PgdA/CDA1 family)
MSFSRIDRAATLWLFYPFIKTKLLRKKGRIPILMYHSISTEAENAAHPYFFMNTAPAVFEAHMKYLFENNYRTISIDEACNCLTTKSQGSAKQVVITFDDGYRNFFTEAMPILSKYNFTATVFLATEFVGDNNKKFNGIDCLNWQEVRELLGCRINIGSHTIHHPKLDSLAANDVRREVQISKDIIEDKIGESIEYFSYPFAFPVYKKKFIRFLFNTLKICGYQNAVTTNIGTISAENSNFFLKRIPVNSDDDLLFFQAKLEGGYDWLYPLQVMKKALHVPKGFFNFKPAYKSSKPDASSIRHQ